MKKRVYDGAEAVKAGARIQERHLDNGMTVLLAERHLDAVVAVMLWYKVGARNEEEREAGVSHFLEHMMFKGSKHFGKGEVDLVTTQLGGVNNAFTTADHTAYWFELASDRWEKALEIEADRMRGLLLDPAEYEAEKAVVLEELSMGLDDPWRGLSELVQGALFPRHPYRRPVIGYQDTLRALDVSDMRDYYTRFYHPGNATIVVCGDFEPEAAFELVKKHFGAIPAGVPYADADCFRPPAGEPLGEQRVTMSWEDSGMRLCIGWPTAAVGTSDDYALDLVSMVLTGGRMSRLHRRIVLESGLATSVSTQNDARVEKGAFWLFAECAQGIDPARLERAIEIEMALLCEETISFAELDRAKRMIAAGEAYDSETVSDLAEEIGEFAVDAHWKLSIETLENIRKTTAKDVRDCARRLLSKDRRVVGWCLPRVKPSTSKSARGRRGKRRANSRGGQR
jgi:zinc protease